MILTSIGSYFVNKAITESLWGGKEKVNFEAPLTSLVWITSIVSIVVTFVISYWQLGHLPNRSVVHTLHHHQLRDPRRRP